VAPRSKSVRRDSRHPLRRQPAARQPERRQRIEAESIVAPATVVAQLLPLFPATHDGEATMLWTIVIILLVLWLLGIVSGTTMGGLIYILLVIAIILVLVRVIQGRRPV
jgi:hypothetical protein